MSMTTCQHNAVASKVALTLVTLYVAACAADSAQHRADGRPARAPVAEPMNRGALAGLAASLDDVVRIELVRLDVAAPAEPLPPAARDTLMRLVRTGALIDARTLAHPPWAAALFFRTRSHGVYAVTLVGPWNLRIDPGNASGRFVGDAAAWNDNPPPEMVLDDEYQWLWNYLESRLGPTREKEYLSEPPPGYPVEMPKPH